MRRVVAGDLNAWHELWSTAQEVAWRVTGNPRVFGRLASQHDERREVVVRVMHRLKEDDFMRLRTFLEEAGGRADEALPSWLTVVATRVAIDHLRAHELYRDRRGSKTSEASPRWIDVGPLDDGHAEQPRAVSIEDIATARRALGHARQTLRSDQLAALGVWLEGHDADEIAARLGLANRDDATRLVRSALKRLRDHYAEAST